LTPFQQYQAYKKQASSFHFILALITLIRKNIIITYVNALG